MAAARSGERVVSRARVLIVDDDALVRLALSRAIGRAHDALAVASALDAVALLEAGRRFDLVLTDLDMPEMTGAEFVAEVAVRWPAMIPCTVVMTACDAPPSLPVPVLTKPLDLDVIARLISVAQFMQRRADAGASEAEDECSVG